MIGHPHRAPSSPAGRGGERGTALVEFALLVPLLFGILFGIVDFGHNFSRVLDIRHGSREGARLVAVNYTGGSTLTGAAQTSVIIGEMCSRMDGAGGATVAITLDPGTATEPAGSVGQAAEVEVSRPSTSLSGVYDALFAGKTMTSTVRVRLEVASTWTSSSGVCA